MKEQKPSAKQQPKEESLSKLEQIRQKISELMKERDKIMFEKGLAAEENKDLRENAAYDFWDRKEHNSTCQIQDLTREIELERIKTKNEKQAGTRKKSLIKKVEKISKPVNRWF